MHVFCMLSKKTTIILLKIFGRHSTKFSRRYGDRAPEICSLLDYKVLQCALPSRFPLFSVFLGSCVLDTTAAVAQSIQWLEYGLDDPGFKSRQGNRIFLMSKRRDRLWSPPCLICNRCQGLFHQSNAAGAWVWQLTSSSDSGVPNGGLGGYNTPPPPKFRGPSKIMPDSTRLWKLLKKILNLGRQHPKMFEKKGSEILKLPPVRNCCTLAMTYKLVVIINSLKVPKIKKILLYAIKILVPNYSCLQNQIPVLAVLCPQLNLLIPTPPPPRTKFLGTPLSSAGFRGEWGWTSIPFLTFWRV